MTHRLRLQLRRALWAGCAVLLAACGGPTAVEERGSVQLPGQARRVFVTALDQIQERYVRQVEIGDLVDQGLANVLKLDPAVHAKRLPDAIEIESAETTTRIPLAAPAQAAQWGAATVGALEAARARSAALREVNLNDTFKAFFDGATKGLDPYSRYNTPEMAREERAQREGFGGIGITIDTDGGDVRVANVMDESPASRANLQVDDRIVTIEGESTRGMTARDVVRRLRGQVGDAVTIELTRKEAPAPLRIALVRAHIVPQTVVYRRNGDIAHIRLTGFNPRTTEALVDALRRAEREIGPRYAGVVLDLRNNFGGYLDQSIYVADVFLPEGSIVSTRGRHRTLTHESWARRGDVGEKVPLVVLINGNSASASEIVAAALQDHNRAVVVGTTSFGKGSVQSILTLPNDGEIILTSARFHAPSGYALAELGVLPHVCTSGGRENVAALLDQVRTGRFADRAAAGRWRATGPDDVEGRKALRNQTCPAEPVERDSDLELARNLLMDRALHAAALASTATLAAR
ncbi:MAG: S41 family peptidase [Alphaproteobacteria bacterium]|nr:S41 family peptidase [Alphaproteobacteria bacterium]